MADARGMGSVVAVGEFASGLLKAVSDACRFEIEPIAVEAIGKMPLASARLLLVSSNIARADVDAALPSIREAHPSLVLVGVAGATAGDSDAVLRSYCDDFRQWPQDRERLLEEIRSAARNVASPWGFLAQWASGLVPILGAAIAFVAVWTGITSLLAIPAYLLPSPGLVAVTFLDQHGSFLHHTLVTAMEALVGFLIGNVFGVLLGVNLHRFRLMREMTMPVFIGLQAVPIIALAPLLVVWLGSGPASKIAMAGIICFFPIVVNTLQAFVNVDRDYVELFVFHRADYVATLLRLLLPASFPGILAALKISAGLAVVGAIVAEFTGSDRGLGYVLLNANYRLETDKLFVAIVLSGALGIVFFQLPGLLKLVVPRSWNREL